FVGATVLLLALVGVLSLGRGLPGTVGRFALGAALLVGAKLFGVPGFNELGRLPLLNLTTILTFAAPLLAFSLVLLAGLAWHAASVAQVSVRRASLALGLFAAYLGLSTWLAWPALAQAGLGHALSTLV